jgi:hypothetical protein
MQECSPDLQEGDAGKSMTQDPLFLFASLPWYIFQIAMTHAVSIVLCLLLKGLKPDCLAKVTDPEVLSLINHCIASENER